MVWQFYININFSEEELRSWVQGQTVSVSMALINRVLGTSEDGHDLENVITEVQFLHLKDRALCAEEWLLHRFDVLNLIERSGSLDSIST